jgi:hypothetical protein
MAGSFRQGTSRCQSSTVMFEIGVSPVRSPTRFYIIECVALRRVANHLYKISHFFPKPDFAKELLLAVSSRFITCKHEQKDKRKVLPLHIIASNSGDSPSLLSYLSSAPAGCRVASCPLPPQHLVTPCLQSGSASTSRHSAASCRAPLHRWCSRLSSTSAVCHVTFRHTDLQLPSCHHLFLLLRPLPSLVRSGWLSCGK